MSRGLLSKFFLIFMTMCVVSSSVFANVTQELKDQAMPKVDGAELFSLKVNKLSKEVIKKQFSKMVLQPHPSYKKGWFSIVLGQKVFWVLKNWIFFNDYDYLCKTILIGVVENSDNRKKLSVLLEKKYGQPNIGSVTDGYRRAKCIFKDGT